MEQAPRIATVTQINGYIKKILDSNIILNNIWIKGEISNFKAHYSGHLYITLKDENSIIKAVMFKSAARSLPFQPEDGMKVLARGRISSYEAGGVYQLYIEEMTPDGVGALHIAYEQLKKKLESEGLFDPVHKKPIPRYPERIGVITATTGAAIRDIINVITRRYPYSEIIIYPATVQGNGAAPTIVKGIKYFNETNCVDTIIAGRGGGSIEDLWAFNEEVVARAIFNSHIPIISAVGHETDFTIADFVSDLRAPTPSAAAEIAVPSQLELVDRICSMNNVLVQNIRKSIENKRLRLDNMKLRNPKEKIEDYSIKLDNHVKDMENAFKMCIMDNKKQLSALCAKLDTLSPLAVIARGYAIPMTSEGNIIKSAKELSSGYEFTLKLNDGNKECIVK